RTFAAPEHWRPAAAATAYRRRRTDRRSSLAKFVATDRRRHRDPDHCRRSPPVAGTNRRLRPRRSGGPAEAAEHLERVLQVATVVSAPVADDRLTGTPCKLGLPDWGLSGWWPVV